MAYDVWLEPWIPVRMQNGSRCELGLGATLEQARIIREIDEPLPALQFGVYRLLLALVMDAYRFGEGQNHLEDFLEEDIWAPEIFDAYYREHDQRFDLFHSEWPFLQTKVPDGHDKKPSSVATLLQHIPSGTLATHFCHSLETEHAWSPKVCARALTAIAPFMTAGGAGYSPSINGAPPWYVLVKGDSLAHTLLYNCWGHPTQAPYIGLGVPSWRRQTRVQPKEEQTHYKMLEAYTWQPRVVQLLEGEGGRCTYTGQPADTLVRDLHFTFGLKTAEPDNWTDPQVAYLDTKAGRKKVMPREGEAPWRNFAALVLEDKRPGVVRQFKRFLEDEVELDRLNLECYGMLTDGKAKIFEWQRDALTFNTGLLEHPKAKEEVQEALLRIEDYHNLMMRCLKEAFQENRRQVGRLLYDELRQPFVIQFLDSLAATRETEQLIDLQARWIEQVRATTTRVFEAEVAKLGVRGDAMTRAAEARKIFYGRLRKWRGD